MEREAFRQRMQQYKQARENNPQLKYWDWKKENDLGYQLYKNNLPSNLQVETDDYDLYGAYESNMQPELNEDGTYHLGSRDPYTGRILKSKQHPTYQKAIESEISAGYFPYEKNNITYTKTYSPVDISGYADGGEVKDNTYVAPVYKEQVFIPATGAQKIKNDYQYKYGSKSPYKGGELEIISPEFDILTGITTLKPIVTKAIRDRARMAVYNNVAPGSYKKSYIAGASKRHEVFNAAKDFLKPGKLEENPKWRKSFQDSSWWEGFGYGNDAKIAEEIREESWKRYLGIKHTPKYYVDNLDGTVSYNLKNIPLKHQQNFVDEVPRGGKVVTGDYIGTAGGNVSASSTIEDGYDLVTLKDVWDLQPIQDANRAAILPSKLRDKISHIEVQPDGYKKIVYNNWVPKWFKNFEVSDVIGKGPFTNKTTIKAVQLKNKDLFTKRILSDEEAANKLIQHDLDIFEPDMYNSVQEAKEAFQSIQNSKLKRLKSLSKEEYDRIKTEIIYKSQDQLLKEYGPYIRPRNKYADGGIIDEDPPQNTSERPITNFDPKGDPYNPTYGYNPGAGYVRSVFDLYDAPVIGDALSIYDATQALKNKDWLGAGLAALTVVPFIPTVSNYKKSLNQQLNRITGITPDISKLQKQSDWNDLRNRSIERLYDPEVRARAAKIKSDYNVDLQSTYDKIINQYENDYFSLPEAEIMQLQDAKAMIDLQEEAARRYKQYGIKPTQKDFRIKIDNAVTPSQEITNHEINHFNQYIHQDNPSWNKSELDKITKQFKGKLRDKNPIDPENTSYFMNWVEQNAYGINMLDRLKELNIKPTKQNILKYLKSLPDTDSIKKAALQFKNLDDYIKWLNTMPLADNGNINEIENYNFA